jgi:hypothetical protein
MALFQKKKTPPSLVPLPSARPSPGDEPNSSSGIYTEDNQIGRHGAPEPGTGPQGGHHSGGLQAGRRLKLFALSPSHSEPTGGLRGGAGGSAQRRCLLPHAAQGRGLLLLFLPSFAAYAEGTTNGEALLEIVPTEQETSMVCGYALGEGERLGETERFILAVQAPLMGCVLSFLLPFALTVAWKDVPRLEQRLLILKMRHGFSGAMAAVRRGIKTYHEACEAVLHSTALRNVLEVQSSRSGRGTLMG